MKKSLFLFLLGWASLCLFPESLLKLNLKKEMTLGDRDIFFQNIASVYEDKGENFIVLDPKAYKVYKFSPSGKLLIAFGDRGLGPGCFVNPSRIFVTTEGNIVVNEIRDFVSTFDESGKFLNRIKLPKGLDLNFLNSDLFYGWVWTPEGKQQVLIDKNGKIIKTFFSVSADKFSFNAADKTGRSVMFNYFTEEYTPFLLSHQYNDHAVIGVTDKYEVILIDKNGKILNKISRDIPPGIISEEEKEYFKRQITGSNKLPDFAKKKFLKKVPNYKNYFNNIVVSASLVWIFRIKDDVTHQGSFIPVDLFTFDMKFKGTLKIERMPYFISPKYIYFEETNSEDDLLLVKYSYSLDL